MSVCMLSDMILQIILHKKNACLKESCLPLLKANKAIYTTHAYFIALHHITLNDPVMFFFSVLPVIILPWITIRRNRFRVNSSKPLAC